MMDDRDGRLHCVVWVFLYVWEGPSSLTVQKLFKSQIGVWAWEINS
jgi:hypothetical protein